MDANTYARINLDNLKYNYGKVKALAKNKKVIAIVKADAYGCGAAVAASVLQNEGCDAFAVANLDEAKELRNSGILKPIFILGYIPTARISEIVTNSLTANIYNLEFAKALSRFAQQKGLIIPVGIALNTGMNRLGFPANEKGLSSTLKVAALPGLKIVSVFSHFATADETDLSFTAEQLNRFKTIVAQLQKNGVSPEYIHIENSAAILCFNDDFTTAVRPGIILYGINPIPQGAGSEIEFKPVMTFLTKVANTFTIDKDATVSYGRKYTAAKKTRVATLCAGYADGYFRLLSGKAEVMINGSRAKIIGNVCMDMLMVDITDIKNVAVGDEAVLFGQDPTARELAELIGTIPYEIMCSLSKRVVRQYEGI